MSLEYAEKTACCLLTIAQKIQPEEGTLVVGDDIEEGAVDV